MAEFRDGSVLKIALRHFGFFGFKFEKINLIFADQVWASSKPVEKLLFSVRIILIAPDLLSIENTRFFLANDAKDQPCPVL